MFIIISVGSYCFHQFRMSFFLIEMESSNKIKRNPNQGTKFNKQDQEVLFFRLTKLFESQNYATRRIASIILKTLISFESSFILLSTIAKDIASDNIYLKLIALKLIPTINEKVSLTQIQTQWEKAVMNENQLISNVAIIQAIKLYQKFPDIIKQWYPQILNQMKQEKNHKNYHVLILLYKISRGNEIYNFNFIKLLHECIKKDATPLFKIHLTKFVKEVIQQEREQQYKKEFIKFLLKELNNQDKMVALEAAKALIQIQQLQTKDTQRITIFLKDQFELETNVINRHFILQLYLKLVQDPKKVKAMATQIDFIQNQCYHENVNMSFTAIVICQKLHYSKNINDYITQIYVGALLPQKVNFLNGLTEFILNYPNLGKQLDIFIQSHFEQITEYQLMKSAITKLQQEFPLKILLNYKSNVKELKCEIIYFIKVKVMKLHSPWINENQIDKEFKNLKQNYQEYFANKNIQKPEATTLTYLNYDANYLNNINTSKDYEMETNSLLELKDIRPLIVKNDEQ
ncbi:hypothetical protein pb186bvf_000857 [Paramecium bursaria]